MFHVTGMQAGMNAPIHTAATLVVLSRWDRDCAGLQIERARVTNWSAITTMLVDFLSNPRLKDYDLSSLRVLGGGGAAMPEARGAQAGGGDRPAVRRGLRPVGDHGAVAHQPAAPARSGSAAASRSSTPMPACSMSDSLKELQPNEVGEIVVHGPQVFQGYWKQPEASAQAFIEHDGKRFFRTGDLGYYDEEGYFFITDRLKRMINCSGYKVWPAEVEAMLYAHPAIQEACVIGSRDAYRGETVKALVVLKSAAKDTCAERHHRLGAREDGGLQGAARGGVRRRAAQDRDRQDPLAQAAGRGEPASEMDSLLALFFAMRGVRPFP